MSNRNINTVEYDLSEEYLKESEPGKKYRKYVWDTAIGLQAVDGLEPSEYLKETAKRNIDGDISLGEVQNLIDTYYRQTASNEKSRTEEADQVSARIATILAEKAFVFSPAQYLGIHKRLFQGVYKHAGQIRDYNISKEEWVLDGDTVTYGGAVDLRETLEYDLNRESTFSYKGLNMDETVRHLARFVADLWQIHVFGEGNTRTTAVFFIKYLRTLGFDVTNDSFAKHSWYFRNAMVRANYNNIQNGVHETTEFLELFLRNLLMGEKNALQNRVMHIRWDKASSSASADPIKSKDDPINDPIKLSEREQKLMSLIEKHPNLTRKELADQLSCSDSTVKRELKILSDIGLIKREGARKNGRWIITKTERKEKNIIPPHG